MRIVITGMGIWTSLGRGLPAFEHALREGESGRRPVRRFDVSHSIYRTREAAVLADESELPRQLDETCIADLALVVAREACEDAALGALPIDRARLGVALGTSHGGNIAFMKFVQARLGLGSFTLDPRLILTNSSTIAGRVAAQLDARGPTVTISTACASGTNSIGRAAELLREGQADVMIAGGADLFTELSYSGFNILGALAPGPCRALDRDRDGMMLGDGAGFVVLEREDEARARGARPWAELAGHAIGNDAHHATAPEPSGAHAARVMAEGLAAGGVDPAEVDYINLHGTGTVANDEMELRAIARLFGERAARIWISSSKTQLGHCLGAAGSVELVATALGIARGFAPPSLNLAQPMAEFAGWSYVRDRARVAPLRCALSNSFGFAGNMSSVVVRKVDWGEER